MQTRIVDWALENGKKIHSAGYIILGPPGIGKTTFVLAHSTDWVDADDIFSALGLHNEEWHTTQHTEQEEKQHYQACDRALKEMRSVGLWVIGSLFWEFHADAIVLINAEQHISYVNKRKDLSWSRVRQIRVILREIALEKSIRIFKSIEDAANKPTLIQFVMKQ